MSTDRMTDGGPLFDPLSNDSTGGIQINLLRTHAQPIVDELGIESAGTTSLGDPAAEADILRPLIPFWAKLDLSYGEIATEWSRISTNTGTTPWSVSSGGRVAVQGNPQMRLSTAPTLPTTESCKYSEKDSGARLELSGKLTFSNVNVRVFPLKASGESLQQLIDKYLDNKWYSFHVQEFNHGEAYVCVLIINFDKVTSKDGVSSSGDRMVRFLIPGELSSKSKDPAGSIPALVPILTFVGEDWNYVTESEVYGRRAFKATLKSPQSTWMAYPPTQETIVGGKAATMTNGLLSVETFLVPEPGKEQQAQLLKVIAIDSLGSPTATREDVRDRLKSTGLDRYATDGFYCVAMKEVLDAATSTEPVYKSLVGIWTTFQMDHPNLNSGALSNAELRIYRYPNLPIADLLGLKDGKRQKEGTLEFQVFTPDKPFYISGNIADENAQNLATWVNGEWIKFVDPFAREKLLGSEAKRAGRRHSNTPANRSNRNRVKRAQQ
jgi:hypothetical protein